MRMADCSEASAASFIISTRSEAERFIASLPTIGTTRLACVCELTEAAESVGAGRPCISEGGTSLPRERLRTERLRVADPAGAPKKPLPPPIPPLPALGLALRGLGLVRAGDASKLVPPHVLLPLRPSLLLLERMGRSR